MCENTKDWFEFILDLNLLDSHFRIHNENNGKYFFSYLIQFIYL